MNQVVERLWVLLHEPESSLAPYFESFARSLDEQGFKRHLLGRQIRMAANFSKWLQAEDVAAKNVTEDHARHFHEGSLRQRSVRRGEFATLRRLLGFLGQLGVTRPLPVREKATPVQQAVGAFAALLRQERALSDKTLIQYGLIIEHFLSDRFGRGPVEFAALRAADVIGFLKRQAAQLSPARAKVATTALRSFFRYLRYCGTIQLDLAAELPPMAVGRSVKNGHPKKLK